MKVTHSRLLELLCYSPDTGVFTWRIKRNNRALAGAIATTLNKGYLRVKIDGKYYAAHRLAWFFVHGEWPSLDIDHRNRVKTDNWIDNLREATQSTNSQNQVAANADSLTGVLGVTLHKGTGKFQAQIGIPTGGMKYLGLHATCEAANDAYLSAKAVYHPRAFA